MNLNLPKTVRSIRRVQTIVGVLTHHGFGHLLDRANLRRYVPLPRQWKGRPSGATSHDLSLGERILCVCEDLGPTFIKLGQLGSTRPDVLPIEIVEDLKKLQDRVPPFDNEQAYAIIEKNLGGPVEDFFESIDPEPLASGSIAQVYRARTRATESQPQRHVVIKVRRPDIRQTVELDMAILRWLSEVLEQISPEISAYQPQMIIDEFEKSLLRELDFIHEGALIARFYEAYRKDDSLRIPRVFWEYTGPEVLTIEELPGRSMQKLIDDEKAEIDRDALARQLVFAFMKQYFDLGFFHADPHPGNLLVQPPNAVGLIDFGLTGHLDDTMLNHLLIGLLGAFNMEPEIVVEVLADMNALGEETDRRQLRSDFLQLIQKYHGLSIRRFDLQQLFEEVTDVVRRNQVTLPRDFVLFGKSLVTIGGICMQLSPDLDLVELTKPKLKAMLARRFTPGRLLKSATISGWHLLNILRSAPSQVRDIFRRLAGGKWQFNIRHQNLDYLATEIDRASNRLSFAVIIGAIILGSSWVLTNSNEEKFFFTDVPMSAIGVLGYLVAGVMGLGLVISILRSGKLS